MTSLPLTWGFLALIAAFVGIESLSREDIIGSLNPLVRRPGGALQAGMIISFGTGAPAKAEIHMQEALPRRLVCFHRLCQYIFQYKICIMFSLLFDILSVAFLIAISVNWISVIKLYRSNPMDYEIEKQQKKLIRKKIKLTIVLTVLLMVSLFLLSFINYLISKR